MRYPYFFTLLLISTSLWHCQKGTNEALTKHETEPTLTAQSPVLALLSPEQTGVSFENTIIETPENNITNNVNIYNGGGLCILDVNNDQLPDLYFIGCSGKNGLFLNEGNLKFKDITSGAGVQSEGSFETAATAVDINADGWMDIYVCRGGPGLKDERRNRLYINNKNLTFTEMAAEYGLDDISASTGANFFDYDNDGDLDCYIINFPAEKNYSNKIESRLGEDGVRRPTLEPREEYDTDRFYRNDNGKFVDISRESGIWELGYGLSVSVTDFNLDGRPDVYVCNDFIQPDRLFINNPNGKFTDELDKYFRHITHYSMGSDITDFDGDGLVDLLAIDMLPEKNKRQKLNQATFEQGPYNNLLKHGYHPSIVRNVLQRNNGNGTFSDVGCFAGMYKTDWSWSGLLFDIDNDGLRDLHITNGYRRETINKDFFNFTLPELVKEAGSGAVGRGGLKPVVDFETFLESIPTYKIRNFCYQNTGNWQFQNVSGKWMTVPASWSCGSAWTDLDLDGDLDLVVNNLEQPAFIYKNLSREQSGNNFLQVKFQGKAPNPFGVGASVRIEYDNGRVQYYENYPTRGIFSSVEHLAHFGLGKAGSVDKLVVRWPDGSTQELTQVPANQRLLLKQEEASGYTKTIVQLPEKELVFKDISEQIPYRHEENEYSDFEAYPMLPWSISDMGPLMATGDVNGDGYEDVYIGNSFEKPGTLLAQQANGTFAPLSEELWQREKAYEDHGALFFDADADGDLDLMVMSGGIDANEKAAQLAWTNRLYLNKDGKGTFSRSSATFPDFNGNLSLRVVAYDYDNDGDQDLFCGGRVKAREWPLTPQSYILRNDGNAFTDVTNEVGADFSRCGMVADLSWSNLDQDPEPELVVVGEWMPVSVFDWENGQLKNKTESFGLEGSNGLWYRLYVSDLDGDGDLDLITGNQGLNTRLIASPDQPLKCYASDFDNNGTLDPHMAYFEDGKEYPFLQREVLIRQMPELKKRFLYSEDYSQATIDEIWSRKTLNSGTVLSIFMLETCWWENQNGTFVRHLLPAQAQLAPVQGIEARDVNGDGVKDLILVGNKTGFEVETNRCDASNGCVLLGKGNKSFEWWNNLSNGFWASGEARDMVGLENPENKPILLISNNNGPVNAYMLKNRKPQEVQ